MNRFLIAFAVIFIAGLARADSLEELTSRSQEAAQVLQNSVMIQDQAIPQMLLARSQCIGTFPNVVRVGFIFGVRYGKGLVSCRVGSRWSNPSSFTITGGSWGLQIGADATDLVLVFVNPDAINKITHSKFTLGGDASISAGPMGRDASAETDSHLRSEIYAYSRTRGLYAGLTLTGAVLDVDNDANAMLYGAHADAAGILAAYYNTSPPAVWPYVDALMTYAK